MTLLQYRTTYINGTPISDGNASSFATIDQNLRLVAVAHIGANENELKFLDKNYSFWPSIMNGMCIEKNVCLKHSFTTQALFPTMEYQNQRQHQ